jgi:ABC-type amino acid transport substrate-binding protein
MMWRHFLIVSISVFVFTQALAAPFTISKSEEAWLNTHPEITVGLLKNSPPISSLNAEGVLEGVDPEIIKLLNERLSGHLKIVTGTWSELYTSGLERRIDALMSLTPSEERRAYFNFTRPYISDPHIIVSGEEGQHFGNLATLAGHTISLEKNSFLASYLSEHYPEIKIRQYASTFEAIKGVEKKEVQAYIGGKLLAEHLIQVNGIKTLDIHGQSDETSETNVIAIRKDWPELGSLLDRALASIAPKELSRVTDHWGLLRPLGVASNNLVLTEEEVLWIQSHPNIVAGAESDWPPYDYVANGKAVGFGNGYLRLLAAKAGLNIEFVHGFTWQELLTKAKNKEIDILPALEKKPEREEFLNFTKPYLENDNCLIVHKNSVGLTSLDDFSGKTLVRIKGYANNKLIIDKYPEIKIVYVDSPLDALMAVSEGRADGYVDFLGVVNYLRREYLIQNLQVATLDAIPSITSTISAGIRKDWPMLNNILEKAMAAVTSDEYENLKMQWFATEDMTQQEFKITSAEKEWLAGLGPLRVGVADSWTPITFPGIDATHQGIASEYLKIIAKKLGLEIVTTVAPWGELVDQIRAGTVDLLPAINETGARREFLAFTTPYLTIQSIIATRSDAPFYAHINDLAVATVGVG